MNPAPKTRTEGFKIECKCNKPNCDVVKEAEASGLSWFLDTGLNEAALSLAILKEAAGGSGVPGLRQAAGIALWIVETIPKLISDRKAAFKHLLLDVWDMTVVLAYDVDEQQKQGEVLSPPMEGIINRFDKTLKDIQEFVNKKLHRVWFMRMIYSQADEVKVDEYRIKLSQATSIFLRRTLRHINDNTEEKVPKGPENLEVANAALKKVHDTIPYIIEAEMDRREQVFITQMDSMGNVNVQITVG